MTSILFFCAALLANPEGQLAFVGGSNEDDACVQVLDMASGQIRRIGPGQRDGAPRWSPDGAWLAFETQTANGRDIWVVRADGTEGRAVSKLHGWNQTPRWSPDGARLAYAADAEQDIRMVTVVCDLATGVETLWGGGRPGILRPVWLPSLELMTLLRAGTQLEWEGVDSAALLRESQQGMLLAVGIAGDLYKYSTELLLVTPSQAAPLLSLVDKESARYAEWAVESDPKGAALAYESNDGGDREIFVLGKRGRIDMTNHPAADWNPVWSPDGKWLAFESFRGKRQGVYRVFVETARVYTVDDGGEHGAWSPSWAPGGGSIAYVSSEGGAPRVQIHAINDGSTTPVNTQSGYALAPAWQPRPKK